LGLLLRHWLSSTSDIEFILSVFVVTVASSPEIILLEFATSDSTLGDDAKIEDVLLL